MTNGITISQEGIDVSQALDSQKVLDSRWRYFEIAQEKIVSLGTITSGKTTEIYSHNLGFLPAFSCYDIATGTYIQGGLRSDKTKIYFDGFFNDTYYDPPSGTWLPTYSNHKVLLIIYSVPITEEYFAPIEKTLPLKTASPSKVGVKITTSNFRQQELSKYTLNTQSKSLAIQKTGVVLANSGTNFLAVIQHNIGNPPIYLATQAEPRLTYITAFSPTFVPVISYADGRTLTFRGAQSVLIGTFAYIIFKELADFAI